MKIYTRNMVTDAQFKKLQKEVLSNKIGQGVGYKITRTAVGTTLNIGRGSSAVTYQPFELVVVMSDDETPVPMIRVVASTLGGGSSLDLGFSAGDEPPMLLEPIDGVVQGTVTIDLDTGIVLTRAIEIVETLGTATASTFYVEIGTVGYNDTEETWSVSNSCYGPIGAQICGGYDAEWSVSFTYI